MNRDPERAEDGRTLPAEDTALTKSHEALERLRNVIVWLKLNDQARQRSIDEAGRLKAAGSRREGEE